jgi:hypothetical protein
MFGSRNRDRDYLFSTNDLQRQLDGTLQNMRREIDELPGERLLNTSQTDLVLYFVEKYKVESVRLLHEHKYMEAEEAQIDVSGDPNRMFFDNNGPVYRPGQRIEIHVPFTGEAPLLHSRASQYSLNPPRATVRGEELILEFEMASDAPRDISQEIDQALHSIQEHLNWQQGQIDAHNGNVKGAAETGITQRRHRILENSQRLSALGIPIRTRDAAPSTYTIPHVRKRSAPSLPPATSRPFEPEPAWAMEQYEHALSIIQQMTLVMERSPSAFRTMDEEALRQHFLVQLNGQFEGKATGETFNVSGKTDILLREGERNVFIAECKFWKGPKKFNEAIDQLLGYTAWRDTKTALLVFNRGTATSTVLSAIEQSCTSHPNFKQVVDWPHESGFRYIYHHGTDNNREFILTVLVFNVPE